jgi:hypothetical protein
MEAPELPDEEIEGELIDPEDVPLCETVWVARRLDFAFDGRLATTQIVPLAVGIDTSEFVSCVATSILHTKNAWALKAGFEVSMQAVELDPIEPDVAILGPSIPLATFGEVGVQVTDVSVLPPRIRVVLTFITNETEATAEQTASLSVSLTFRRHAPVRYLVRSPGAAAPSLPATR